MTKTRLELVSPVEDSARVARIVGAADKPNLREVVTTIEFDEPPSPEEPWSIGMIVGASGSGKSTVARTRYGSWFYQRGEWSKTRAIVDGFDERPFDELASALAAVGFASQTRWLRPYDALSSGERFRCDLCKALLDAPGSLVVVDEFASLVDEKTAKTASIALRKAFDRGAFAKKLVAVAHRRDVQRWLEPDWTLDMETGTLTRRRLRRPEIVVEVRNASSVLWRDFAPFHYLTGSLNKSARCYAATIDGEPVAFAAIMQSEGRRGRRRVHRLVVAPTWQGIGVGSGFLDALGALELERGRVLEIVSGSAPLIRRLERSERWRFVRAYPHGRTRRRKGKETKGSFGRAIVSFIYRQPRSNKENIE